MALFAPSKAKELREQGRQKGREEALKEFQVVIDGLRAKVAELEKRLAETK